MTDQILQLLKSYATWLTAAFLPICAILAAVSLLVLAIRILLRFIGIRQLRRQPVVYLELTPPSTAEQTAYATQQLFTFLHGLSVTQTWLDRLLQRQVVLSTEISSTREQGIRYILRVSERDSTIVQQNITSYLPEVKIRPITDYIPADLAGRQLRIDEFKQTRHFAYPLKPQVTLDEHDPISYLTNAMTHPVADELIALQLVIVPVLNVREVHHVTNKIRKNRDAALHLENSQGFLRSVVHVLGEVPMFITSLISDVFDSFSSYSPPPDVQYPATAQNRPFGHLDSSIQQLITAINQKVSQPLFQVSIRALVIANDKQSIRQRLGGLRTALASFREPKYQALKAKPNWLPLVFNKRRSAAFRLRLPVLFRSNACLLSASELADLYHLPYTRTTKTENIIKSLSRTLPAPVSLKDGTPLDVLLGQNTHNNTVTPVGLSSDERARHIYTIGSTGSGKTTMMQYAIVQDIKNGKGVAVIDPHGDMAKFLLRHIPEERINDVIYFDPDDLDYPIGLNLLELTPGLSPSDTLRQKERITESTVSIFRKIFSEEDAGGHRIEYLIRNTVQTALTLENPTLFTIFDLLNNPKFRQQVVASLDNEDLKNFWQYEFAKAGDFQQVKMSAGVTAKIGRFLFSASAKRILEQPKSTINFTDILDSSKILICNFSKGRLGEDTSELFGITILAKLQLAAWQRESQPEATRIPFYLYVDEFQNFATPSFVQMLSEARKYKLHLFIAEQSTSQQDDQRMVNTILNNVGTVICFRCASPMDERTFLPYFDRYIEPGELANLPKYNFYAKIAAIEPFSGVTIKLPEDDEGERLAKRVIEASRNNYAVEYVDTDNNTLQPAPNNEAANEVTDDDPPPASKSPKRSRPTRKPKQ